MCSTVLGLNSELPRMFFLLVCAFQVECNLKEGKPKPLASEVDEETKRQTEEDAAFEDEHSKSIEDISIHIAKQFLSCPPPARLPARLLAYHRAPARPRPRVCTPAISSVRSHACVLARSLAELVVYSGLKTSLLVVLSCLCTPARSTARAPAPSCSCVY